MSETIQLTPSQLRIAIAELLGWADVELAVFWPYTFRGRQPADVPGGYAYNDVPNWTDSIADAWNLLTDEFTNPANLHSVLDYYIASRKNGRRGTYVIVSYVIGGHSEPHRACIEWPQENRVPLAISCAFYEAMTGQRVEIKEEATVP